MILIISEHIDASTDRVITWISSFGGSFFRINYQDLIDSILIKEDKNRDNAQKLKVAFT